MDESRINDRLKPLQDSDDKEPEVYAVSRGEQGFRLTRRAFLGGMSLGIAGAVANGCSEDSGKKEDLIKTGTSGTKPLQDTPDCQGLKAHADWVRAVAVSPDGTFLASGSQDKTIKLWSLPEGHLIKTLTGETNIGDVLAISPDGKILASGAYGILKRWSLPEGDMERTLGNHRMQVQALAFGPGGTLLASGSGEGTIKLWKMPEGELANTLEKIGGDIPSLAIGLGDKDLFVPRYNSILHYSLPDFQLIQTLEGHSNVVNAVAVSPDGTLLASGGWDKTVKLWSLPDGQLEKTLKHDIDFVKSIAFSPDGTLVAAAYLSGAITLWSLPDGKYLRSLKGDSKGVYSIAFSPDGTLLASANRNGTVKIWSMPDGNLFNCLYDPSQVVEGKPVRSCRRMGRRTRTLPCGSPAPPGAVCTCDCISVSSTWQESATACTCDTVTVLSAGPLPKGSTCQCDTVAVGTAPMPKGQERQMSGPACGCDTVCSCVGHRSQGTGAGHYWRPN